MTIIVVFNNRTSVSEGYEDQQVISFTLFTNKGLYLDIQPVGSTYSCHGYSASEEGQVKGGIPESQVCASGGNTFTGGNNADYKGCGSCWCCKPSKIVVIATQENKGISQQWLYNSNGAIINKASGLCLTIDNNIMVEGARLYLEPFNIKQVGQSWNIDDKGYIKSRLDETFVLTVNPAKIQSNSVFISKLTTASSSSTQQQWSATFQSSSSEKSLVYNFLNKIKKTITCSKSSGDIKDHPDFDQYMLKSQCPNIKCLSPLGV